MIKLYNLTISQNFNCVFSHHIILIHLSQFTNLSPNQIIKEQWPPVARCLHPPPPQISWPLISPDQKTVKYAAALQTVSISEWWRVTPVKCSSEGQCCWTFNISAGGIINASMVSALEISYSVTCSQKGGEGRNSVTEECWRGTCGSDKNGDNHLSEHCTLCSIKYENSQGDLNC